MKKPRKPGKPGQEERKSLEKAKEIAYRIESSVKNHADALIFHTRICVEAPQILSDAMPEIAYSIF